MGKKRKIINIYTLEVFDSMVEAAKKIGVSKVSIFETIHYKVMAKGTRFEYFDEWIQWPPQEKEKFSKRNNIYFYYKEGKDDGHKGR